MQQEESTAAAPTPPAEATSARTLPRRQVVITMGGVVFGVFLASLDQTVVGTAIPRIVADLGGFDRITWVTGAYLVASTTSVPIVGRLSDLYGRKLFYMTGIAVFLVGSVLCGLSQTMEQLIAFRAIQGLGGGVLLSISFVIVADLFPPAERGRYMGIVSAVFGLSSVIGPTLGGVITDTLSWNWIFYVNLPLGIPLFFIFLKYFPVGTHLDGERHLDVAGMFTLVLAVVPLLVGLSFGGQYGWISPEVVGLLVLSVAMTGAFIVIETRAPDPIMPFDIYRNQTVSLSLLAVFGSGFGMFGAIVFIPLFFQGVLGASATSSGSFLTPMMLGVVIGAAISGQALSRWGGHYRLQGVGGLAVMALGMALISTMTANTSFPQAVLYIVIMGFGLGTTFPTYTIAVQNAVPQGLLGIATSSVQFYRSIGGSLGLAILGAYMASRFASGLTESLPETVRQMLPPGRLDDIAENPQALVNPEALAGLRASFDQAGPDAAGLADQLLEALRVSLASAIGDVFVIGVVAALLALVATLFVTEQPLKGWQDGAREPTVAVE